MSSRGRRRAAAVSALALVAAIVALSSSALAHPAPAVERYRPVSAFATAGAVAHVEAPITADRDVSAARSAVGTAAAVLALATLLAVAGARARCRWALRLVLALGLLGLPYEIGLHSVHHLGSAEGASQCAVAGMTSHLSATVDSAAVTLMDPAGAGILSVTAEVPRPLPRAWSPWRGRAPPVSPAI